MLRQPIKRGAWQERSDGGREGRGNGRQRAEPTLRQAIAEGRLLRCCDDADNLGRGRVPREHTHAPTVERMPGQEDKGERCLRPWWIAVRSLLVAMVRTRWVTQSTGTPPRATSALSVTTG